MITEDYVSFETAKLLKEKGFDEYGMYFYTLKDEGREGYKFNKRLGEFAHNSDPDLKDRAVSCPTLQMAMKWLREVYGICIELLFHPNKQDWGWYFQILVIDDIKKCFCGYGPYKTYSSYEQACEAAIKYCLENLI